MLFTSYAFPVFFLALLLVYYFVPASWQWKILLAASFLFYALSDLRYLLYISVTTVTVWFAGCGIEDNLSRQNRYLKEKRELLSREERQSFRSREKRKRTLLLLACILLNLGILCDLKYLHFFLSGINRLLPQLNQSGELTFSTVILPLGISFYTLQAIGYLIDVSRESVPAQRNLLKFALFISFFPQLIQGPISRYGDLSHTLYGPHPFQMRTVTSGLQRTLWGYFKKLVVADRVNILVSVITGHLGSYPGAYVVVALVFYTLQLYADFTGGIDITIGIAEMMGIGLQENFDHPYFSTSLEERWRRWHISLCSWFRDYLFYPLSASRFMLGMNRFLKKHGGKSVSRRLPVYLSSFAVWLATGLWHGAGWNFAAWGIANWVILMCSRELKPLYQRFHKRFALSNTSAYRLFMILRTILIVSILNVFECYGSLPKVWSALCSMFQAGNWNILWSGALLKMGLTRIDFGILAVSLILMIAVSLMQRKGSVRERIAKMPYPVQYAIWYGLLIVILLMGVYGFGYDEGQFIYTRF